VKRNDNILGVLARLLRVLCVSNSEEMAEETDNEENNKSEGSEKERD